jgi:hypothetical protein
MAYRRFDEKHLLAFLEKNHPALHKKYKGYTHAQFYNMKESEPTKIHGLISKYALHEGYQHGDVIEFIDEGMRGRDLLYWDALKGKPIYPEFDHGDASLPEAFVVGDGFFDPLHWGGGWHPLRPCKALIKEIKTHFSKLNTPLEVTINGKMYTVKKKGDDWDEYNWNKMMLVPIGKNTLVVNSDYSSVGKAVNEDNLRALLAGDNVKRAQTRKLDLETKLKVAEQKVKDAEQSLKDAQEEVVRLRSELDGIGKRGTRRV